MTTVAQLVAAGIAPTQARTYAPILAAALPRWGITTRVRIAAWLAQVGHESAGFTRTEENLYYTTPERIRAMWPTRVPSLQVAATLTRNPQALANTVYSNRLGNGDPTSGDGWKYRGRGLIQLTGRANYMAAGDALQSDYKSQPDLVAVPRDAVLTACWFWGSISGNAHADNSDIEALTRRINGAAMAGLADRRARFEDALRALA